jgi:hypothetical protein
VSPTFNITDVKQAEVWKVGESGKAALSGKSAVGGHSSNVDPWAFCYIGVREATAPKATFVSAAVANILVISVNDSKLKLLPFIHTKTSQLPHA